MKMDYESYDHTPLKYLINLLFKWQFEFSWGLFIKSDVSNSSEHFYFDDTWGLLQKIPAHVDLYCNQFTGDLFCFLGAEWTPLIRSCLCFCSVGWNATVQAGIMRVKLHFEVEWPWNNRIERVCCPLSSAPLEGFYSPVVTSTFLDFSRLFLSFRSSTLWRQNTKAVSRTSGSFFAKWQKAFPKNVILYALAKALIVN